MAPRAEWVVAERMATTAKGRRAVGPGISINLTHIWFSFAESLFIKCCSLTLRGYYFTWS